MDVFISWSGERSKKVAELLKTWLKCVVQASKPWMSSQSIAPGSVWFTKISETLNRSRMGVVCLTPENRNNPWILFEAGALAKGMPEASVFTLLIDLKPTDIEPPLSQFNHTLLDENGLFRLVQEVNSSLGESELEPEVLRKAFDTYWPELDTKLQKIANEKPVDHPVTERSPVSMLEEILKTTRGLAARVDMMESSLVPNPFGVGALSQLNYNSGGLGDLRENLENSQLARIVKEVKANDITKNWLHNQTNTGIINTPRPTEIKKKKSPG